MLEKYTLFIALAFVAEVIGTISGFGSSILFVPLAALFFDFKTVLGITAVFHVFINLSKIALFRKGIQKDIALKLGLPALISVIAGAYLTTLLSTTYIELGMHVVLLFLAVFLLFKFNKPIRQTNSNLLMGGIASGFIAGVAGTGGAIRGITLAAFQLPKDIFIATSALIDLGVDASRATIYVANGYLKREYLILIPLLVVVSFLGSYAGKLILNKTAEKTFRRLVLVVIVVTAISQIVSTLSKYNA